MEVAGLVLGVVGVLPIIINVVDGYQIIVEITRVKRFMAILGRDLSTERIILRNTYERLLNGIVPSCDIDTLRNVKPSSTEWLQYDLQIRERLRDSYKDFQIRVKAIDEAVQELQEKLADGKFRNWPSMVSELERRTRFTLKRKDYVGTVAKIHENNTLLSRLVEHSTSFEPTRRANSQANAAKTIRNLTHGLFSSICNVLSCQCAGSHGVGLRLPPRVGARQVLDDDGQPLDSATSFDIIFSTNMPRKARYDYEEVPDSSTWEGLHFRWKDLVKGSSTSLSSSVDSLSTEESKRAAGREGASSLGVSLTLRERFARLRRSSSPQASTPELRPKVRFAAAGTTPGPAQSPTLSLITELCLKFQQKNGISKQPVGFVPCDRAPKGFNIYHHDHIPASSHTATLTLRQALSREQRLPMEFELVERLKIALALSSGILQICSTPWLGTIITLDNIVFIREGGAPSHYFKGDFDYPNPFLVHSTPVAAKPEKKPRPINFALLSLGILLTHIALGYPVEAIEFWENMTKQKLVSRSKLAYEKVATCDDASDNYIEAVNWCFQHCFNFATLEDADLTRSFHDAVITRLERDLSSINMLEITA